MSNQDFPHVVELPLPSGGFGPCIIAINTIHRERAIPIGCGRGRNEGQQLYIRFCFADVAAAFASHFGGKWFGPPKQKP